MSRTRELTPKQQRFCEEYLIDLNATQAAIRAGYSAKTAQPESSRLLSKVMVQATIAQLMQQRSERTRITSDYVLRRLHEIESVDVRRAYDEKGRLLPWSKMPEDIARIIESVKVSEDFLDSTKVAENKEVIFPKRVPALTLLGRHLKMFVDRIEVKDTGDLAQMIQEGRKRAMEAGDGK